MENIETVPDHADQGLWTVSVMKETRRRRKVATVTFIVFDIHTIEAEGRWLHPSWWWWDFFNLQSQLWSHWLAWSQWAGCKLNNSNHDGKPCSSWFAGIWVDSFTESYGSLLLNSRATDFEKQLTLAFLLKSPPYLIYKHEHKSSPAC